MSRSKVTWLYHVYTWYSPKNNVNGKQVYICDKNILPWFLARYDFYPTLYVFSPLAKARGLVCTKSCLIKFTSSHIPWEILYLYEKQHIFICLIQNRSFQRDVMVHTWLTVVGKMQRVYIADSDHCIGPIISNYS
jgi:hypothetical protein